MKKLFLLLAAACFLSACQSSNREEEQFEPAPQMEPMEQQMAQCPSCEPAVPYFEVVTQCSDFAEKNLGNGAFTQCRVCTNKIYSNGVDVTAQFMKNGANSGTAGNAIPRPRYFHAGQTRGTSAPQTMQQQRTPADNQPAKPMPCKKIN